MILTSGIAKRYTQAFILDEDSLRRIYSVLEKSAKDLPEASTIVFHVEREDERYYETSDINDVLSDPNINEKRINLLSIELRLVDIPENSTLIKNRDWIVMVVFSYSDNTFFPRRGVRVAFHIASDNKNWALLLSDELEPQIQRTFKAKHTPRWTLVAIAFPFILFSIKIISLLNLPKDKYLNFILFVLMILAMLFLLVFSQLIYKGIPQWFVRAFGPEAVFLWGEEMEAYQNRERTRQNILWAIIVGFIISLAASIIFAFLFAPRSMGL